MSPRQICRALAGTTILLMLLGSAASAQPPSQPRDPRTDVPRPPSARELQLQSAVTADPNGIANWLELAKLQEERGALMEAEAALKAAVGRSGGAHNVLMAMAQFYNRSGQFEKTMTALQDAAAQKPLDPAGHHLVATYYWEKAYRDHRLTDEEKLSYIDAGIAASDRALMLNADYVESLVYKNLLLRMKANASADAAERARLTAEADMLRSRAMELQKARAAGAVPQTPAASMPGPPPPPPAAADSTAADLVDGQQPVRVGGNIKTPRKIKDVPPVYPSDALAARVSGLVILEAVIGADGAVRSARVVRSIPMLDEAAMEAVKQWRFTPTLVDGIPVPVRMTVTVNFTIQ